MKTTGLFEKNQLLFNKNSHCLYNFNEVVVYSIYDQFTYPRTALCIVMQSFLS